MKSIIIVLFMSVAVCSAFTATTTITKSSVQQHQQRNQIVVGQSSSTSSSVDTVTDVTNENSSSNNESKKDPLLIRAARGESNIERTPVWMMRQAGRHIAEYRELCKQYPTFRQRSEITEVAVEVSLQPYRNYNTDGCILFSDILTPLPGMGCDFIIDEMKGPIMSKPIKTYDDLKQLQELDPIQSTPFVREALQELRKAVSHTNTAVLGFVGCPYTLATYIVEGKSSKDYLIIKQMMYNEPQLLHSILQHVTNQIAQYALYQIESGAQLIQIFDSWAGHLSPYDYDTFAAPYQKQILDTIKEKYPNVPTVLYIKHSGALIERMASTGVDVVSLDWTVDMDVGRKRIDTGRYESGIMTLDEYTNGINRGGVQGNLDPAILYAKDQSVIYDRTVEILKKAGPIGHVMNLGHGIEATTPEANAAYFIETVRNYRHS